MNCSYKSPLEPELCLGKTGNRRHWLTFVRIQTGSNHLYTKRCKCEVPRKNRLYKYRTNINIHYVEDKYHFIMECTLYREDREEYLSDIINVVNIHKLMSSRKHLIIKKLSI